MLNPLVLGYFHRSYQVYGQDNVYTISSGPDPVLLARIRYEAMEYSGTGQ